MDSKLEIIAMDERHLRDILCIERESFGSEAWSESAIAAELGNSFSIHLVALLGGQIAGYLLATSVWEDGQLNSLAVAQAVRRHGVGDALLRAMLDEMRRRDTRHVTLEVRESNGAAQALYRRNGFAAVGIRKKFYHNPTEDALLMKCALVDREEDGLHEDTRD